MLGKLTTYFRQISRRNTRNRMPPKTQRPYQQRVAAAKCKQCLDTGKIVRGHDGRVITCPSCRHLA